MMTSNQRLYGRRTPSAPKGPLSRLLPTASDPLDAYGLPSKGETRLNDFKAQEAYYNKIVERYVQFCADSGNTAELEKQFSLMSFATSDAADSASHQGISALPTQAIQRDKSSKIGLFQKTPPAENTKGIAADAQQQAVANKVQDSSPPSPVLTTILHAMRKLRESIVATSRQDLFAQRAYLFIIRASILVRHLESYHPALIYLLSTIHWHTPLSASELHEFVSYLVLDLACRQGDLQGAFLAQLRFRFKDRRVDKILGSLVHDDWLTFWKLRKTVDGHQRALMEWAVDNMRLHALKCLGRSYFTAERSFVENSADMRWDKLVRDCNVGWQLDGEKITIRRPKSK